MSPVIGLILKRIMRISSYIFSSGGLTPKAFFRLLRISTTSLLFFLLIGYNVIMLKQKIYQDQIQALKKHDQEKLSILRYILAQIKNQEIEKKSSQSKGGLDLTDDETISVLRKNVKELNESIESFKKGGRQDLVLEYQKQLQVVSSYLPKELSDEELEQEIEKF